MQRPTAQPAGSEALELERFLPYRLSILSNTVSGAIAGAYAQAFGLSIPEWRVMAILALYPGVSARDVAERTAMDKVAVSRAVGRLLAARRIDRQFDPQDRRRSILALSAQGAAIYRRIRPLALDYERALLAVLSPNERGELDRLLDKVQQQAAALGPLAPPPAGADVAAAG